MFVVLANFKNFFHAIQFMIFFLYKFFVVVMKYKLFKYVYICMDVIIYIYIEAQSSPSEILENLFAVPKKISQVSQTTLCAVVFIGSICNLSFCCY